MMKRNFEHFSDFKKHAHNLCLPGSEALHPIPAGWEGFCLSTQSGLVFLVTRIPSNDHFHNQRCFWRKPYSLR